jgi:predicted ribosome quality control (RQC) complex YloA/Tae2 family protein
VSAAPGSPGAGLNAAELALVVAELQAAIPDATVRDVAILAPHDDLVLLLEGPPPIGRRALRIAVTPERARVCLAAPATMGEGAQDHPRIHALRAALQGALVTGCAVEPGDRRMSVTLRDAQGRRRTLVAELFGRPGNWLLLDGDTAILALANLVEGRARTLAVGQRYVPPRAAGAPATGANRFGEPDAATAALNRRVDEFFRSHDQALAFTGERDALLQRARQQHKRLADRLAGLTQKLVEIAGAARHRQDADLLLANLQLLRRGMTQVELPDLYTEGSPERIIALDPKRDGRENAEALFDRARSLEDSRAMSEALLGEAQGQVALLAELLPKLEAAASPAALDPLRADLQQAGLAPRPAQRPASRPPPKKSEPFRRFVSAEGYPILVGRSNTDNDELTLRVANGNDLWLHVGQGFAGSHVVVRLPREKTASLETLLDAAALAAHFSKARGRGSVEVIYTPRKFVRKPKGMKPGAVTVERSKSVRVQPDAERLKRVLGTGNDD